RRAIPDLAGETITEGVQEERLRARAIQLERGGQAEHGLDEPVVEIRHPRLDGMRHAHDVGVAEELVAEIVAEFEPRQGLAQVPGSRSRVPGERGRRRLEVTLRGAEEIPHGSAREESANEMVDARRRRPLEGGEPIE